MARIGEATSPSAPRSALTLARQRAALMPDLLVEARRIANTVISGWHGRRKRGMGENFWQFRPYVDGETVSKIDWRRSARDEHVYVRDKEWEAAHTIWLWADSSPSMLFKSQNVDASKQERALILVLALAELLSRSGERIAWPQLGEPFTSRNGAEKLATQLLHANQTSSRADFSQIQRFSDAVIISDFLDPVEEIQKWLDALASRGVRAHLIEIVDPAEESFPYTGRTEFSDPESGNKLTSGRAELFAQDYRRLYIARRDTLAQWCARLGWSYTVSRTDKSLSETLVHLHTAMAASSEKGWR